MVERYRARRPRTGLLALATAGGLLLTGVQRGRRRQRLLVGQSGTGRRRPRRPCGRRRGRSRPHRHRPLRRPHPPPLSASLERGTPIGASGHLATATVRWLDPDTRTPHEESGDLEARSFHDSLWTSPGGIQVAAVAAYFADALRGGAGPWRALPGRPSLGQLSERAEDLARDREDKGLHGLAQAIRTAYRGAPMTHPETE